MTIDHDLGPASDEMKHEEGGLTKSDIRQLIRLLYRLKRHFKPGGECAQIADKSIDLVEDFKVARIKGLI